MAILPRCGELQGEVLPDLKSSPHIFERLHTPLDTPWIKEQGEARLLRAPQLLGELQKRQVNERAIGFEELNVLALG